MSSWVDSMRERLGRFPLSILQLGMRIGVGMVFFNAGLLKYKSFEFAVKLFEDEYKVPVLAPAVGIVGGPRERPMRAALPRVWDLVLSQLSRRRPRPWARRTAEAGQLAVRFSVESGPV